MVTVTDRWTRKGQRFHSAVVHAHVLCPSSESFQDDSNRSKRPHWKSQGVHSSSLVCGMPESRWERAAFLFLSCSPCNLKSRQLHQKTGRKSQGPIKSKLGVGSPMSWAELLVKTCSLETGSFPPVWTQRGSLSPFRSFSLAPYSKFHKGDNRKSWPQLRKQRWNPDLFFFFFFKGDVHRLLSILIQKLPLFPWKQWVWLRIPTGPGLVILEISTGLKMSELQPKVSFSGALWSPWHTNISCTQPPSELWRC